ncbi:N-acetyltransferase GCN5 [Yersinia nurmii]|uniref:N-acetyltransferase GCN5 n=1 Tax=Yersinia nurmii TaxID=685706 RepID=A0ABP1YHJ1_9GAMM|nr:beta/gamma crystallin domain-containing protein [Yersinia nurmii]CNE84961.1 N-acetyltransferase GCN5 [Yersinia nurmii]
MNKIKSIAILSIMPFYALGIEPEICFYKNDNFNGESICAYQGEMEKELSDIFNDQISSIKIPKGMKVTIYQDSSFSGKEQTLTQDTNIDELKSLNLHDSISSFKIDIAACIYNFIHFTGDSMCISPGENVDLYTENIKLRNNGKDRLPLNNDAIESIRIPKGIKVEVYKNDGFKAPYFQLIENTDYTDLEKIGLQSQISSIKVYENDLLTCDYNCIVWKRAEFNIPRSFGSYWNDSRLPNKQVLLVFDISKFKDDFEITLTNGPKIDKKEDSVLIKDKDDIFNYPFEISSKANKISIIYQFKRDTVQVQYIESLNTVFLGASPLISYKWSSESEDIAGASIIIENKANSPVEIEKVVLTADSGQLWTKRDGLNTILCWTIPFLNIYNYIVQGRCNQISGIVYNIKEYFDKGDKSKTLQISGSARPLPPAVNYHDEKPIKDANSLTLTHLDSTKNNQSLTLPATAKACKVSIYPLLLERTLRQIRPACINWTLEVMTDFTLLFGGSVTTWNPESFGNVIDNIIKMGITGFFPDDKETEKRLVQSVQEQIAKAGHNNTVAHLKTAFDYAQLGYINYLTSNTSIIEEVNPRAAQLLPLGIYELPLSSYEYEETIPRIRENSSWVEHPELQFEVEIVEESPRSASLSERLNSNTEESRALIMNTVSQWGELYQTSPIPQDVSEDEQAERGKLSNVGHIVTGIMARRLESRRQGEIYIIVRLRGEIVTIVLADSFRSEQDVELIASATNPAYVLTPTANGAIRGAGTAGIRVLAKHLKQKGARALISEVISQPSAIVKEKVGFTFRTEL